MKTLSVVPHYATSIRLKTTNLLVVILALAVAVTSYAGGHGRSRGVGSSPVQQFEGVVKSASATSLVIIDAHNADHTFALNTDTVIRKGDQRVAPSALAVGDRVHVAAGTNNSVLTAIEVVVQDTGENEVEAEGTVTAVGVQQLTLHTQNADLTVKIDTSTIIRKAGQVITLGDVKIGDLAGVKGTSVDATTILAGTIEIESADDHGEASVTGAVASITPPDLVVKGVTIHTDSSTIIRKDDKTITLADIKVGDMAAVKGTLQADKSILAAEIEVETPEVHPPSQAFVTGAVASITPPDLVVKGVTIHTDSSTIIRKDDKTITLADIKVGDMAAVKGTLQTDKSILAAEIEVETPEVTPPAQAFVTGAVASITPPDLVVKTVTVHTDSKTIIRRDDMTISLADIKVGDMAAVRGTLQADKSILAVEIEVAEGTGHH